MLQLAKGSFVMLVVAQFLLTEACNRRQFAVDEAELFAKSVVNRSYYALLLATRSMVLEVCGSSTPDPSHSGMPRTVQRMVCSAIIDAISRHERSRSVDQLAAASQKLKVTRAGERLAELLREAKSIRNAADYTRDMRMEWNGIDFVLSNTATNDAIISTKDALNWCTKGDEHIVALKEAWTTYGT